MSHGIDLAPARDPASVELRALPALLRGPARLVHLLHHAVLVLGMVSLVAAAAVLSWSVFSRHMFQAATDWQDEAAMFLLVGATFLCAGHVQLIRGHVGIEALAGVLPRAVNRLRLLLVDLISLAFCLFFSWKSWTLWHEAWVEQQTTSSSWAPPLAIPYGLMALGMSLLSLQLLLQTVVRVAPQDGSKS